MSGEKEGSHTAEQVLSTLLTLGYVWWVWYSRSTTRTPPKIWLSHRLGLAAEKATAAAWDTTLKLRRYYRHETEGS